MQSSSKILQPVGEKKLKGLFPVCIVDNIESIIPSSTNIENVNII